MRHDYCFIQIICLDLLNHLLLHVLFIPSQDFYLRITFLLPRVHSSKFPLVKNSHLYEVSKFPLFPWCRILDFFLLCFNDF